VLVLRPAPGDRATVAGLEAAGLVAIRLPLFEIVPMAWVPPKGEYDALLLTSANAVRQAGPGLEAIRGLPTIAVGKATAEAARASGLSVAAAGNEDGAAALALAHARGWKRVVRLAGRERTPLGGVTDLVVYASEPRDVSAGALAVARGAVALLHSTRAAARFATLVDREGMGRRMVRLAAISAKVAAEAGADWGAIRVADAPCDAALIAAAMTLAIDP
jgi:uroporphyrinogen-III synthase